MEVLGLRGQLLIGGGDLSDDGIHLPARPVMPARALATSLPIATPLRAAVTELSISDGVLRAASAERIARFRNSVGDDGRLTRSRGLPRRAERQQVRLERDRVDRLEDLGPFGRALCSLSVIADSILYIASLARRLACAAMM